jgi:Pseudouridylate synthases, 23S RNA-specific
LFTRDQQPAILLDTPDFIIAAKPPGMETISQNGGPELVAMLRAMLGDDRLYAAHRLDRDTSGAQLVAKGKDNETLLANLFRQRLVEKTYLALCLGAPRNRTGTINRNLSEWDGGRRPVRVVKKGGLTASTAYEVQGVSDCLGGGLQCSLIAFHPRQGRTHQIRVHAAAFGYPILGDDQYGDRAGNRQAKRMFELKRQALHSWKLGFAWKGVPVAVTCPPEADMERVMEKMVFP